ncbi:hypothetical protein [Saccharopolyspora erythraea]|uniref:Integrase/recombinase n=1 Tax=Saccharopolyspora erythraea TaxID=1836 RepID=A0ABP3MHT9_SACER|nr:hypothetical protein [Saccharopolyspora erythraea]EQD81846.1 hypothetical protein N599_33910 [Saccharopolyspora erythraea D]QRK93118.1 hypothetical protein JQX30_18655 [Saccharopolyspora erythraea]
MADDDVGEVLESLWGRAAVGTWNARRAAVGSWLAWCRDPGFGDPAPFPAGDRPAGGPP